MAMSSEIMKTECFIRLLSLFSGKCRFSTSSTKIKKENIRRRKIIKKADVMRRRKKTEKYSGFSRVREDVTSKKRTRILVIKI